MTKTTKTLHVWAKHVYNESKMADGRLENQKIVKRFDRSA